jgi:hypothetical protein
MSEQREMSGILSRNDKRESEKQPEFRGECTIEGKAYRISAWVKEGKSGKFMSLAFDGKKPAPRRYSDTGMVIGLDRYGKML